MNNPLEEMMSSIFGQGGGWKELDNAGVNFGKMAKEQGAAEQAELDRQSGIITRALSTKDGKDLLDLLMRMTLLRQPDEAERAAGANAEAYAIAKAKREGQNDIVFMLLARMQHQQAQKKEAAADKRRRGKTKTTETGGKP